MLQILALGPPAILLDDKPLDIQRRQLRTLLYFLACEPEGVGRGELLTRFWPDVKESDARRQLREILSKLRAQLPTPDDLQTDHDRVWLNSQTVYRDVQDFLALIEPAQNILELANHNSLLTDDLVERLEKAVALWRSPTFLAGVRISNTHEFDDWVQEKASNLEYFRLQSLERLADHFTSIRELDKAILYVHKALESDYLNEVLQAQLLSLLYNTGRISEAQTYYSYLKELYQRELNAIPPEILTYTMDEVVKKPFEGRNRPLNQAAWRMNTNQYFIGRVNELEKIEKVYRTGGVLLINGEIGSGKTQFVQHFYTSLHEKPRLFYTSCQAEDTNLPLQPIINLIRNFITADDWDKLDQRWLKPLTILVPDIIRKTYTGQVVNDSPSKEGRLELFEAIHRLFLSASRTSRVILILDDIHWSDLDTFEALMYLTRQGFFGKYGFCILTSRSEIADFHIKELLVTNKHHIDIPRIDLGPLSRKETTGLTEHVLGQVVSESFIERLHKATGGNPLFIIETLNAMQTSTDNSGDISQENIPLAENLAAIILEKEKNLSNAAKEVLSVAAVCGMEFQLDILEQMHFCDSNVLTHCLEELEENQFIHPISSSGYLAQYSFNHNLIRDSLINRLSQARLHHLHEEIAKAMTILKGSLNNRQSSIIARHYEYAGKSLQAFQFWVKAGLYARSLFSIHEAFSAFQRANRIAVDYGPEIQTEDLYELYSEWGDLAYNIMDTTALDECYSAMYDIGMQINEPLLIGAGLSGMAISAIFNLEVEKAAVLLEQSIQILDTSDNLLEKIVARSRMGIVLSTENQNEKAIEFYQAAIELGKDLPSQAIRQAVATVQYQLSILYSIMGWPEKARTIGKQGLLNAYLLISKPTAQANAHMSLAMAAYWCGAFSEAKEQIRLCLKVSESLQNMRTISLINILQAKIHCHHGRVDIAWNLVQKALEVSAARGFFENVAEAYCVRGDIFLMIRDFPNAIREYSLGYEHLSGSYPGMNCYYRLGFAHIRNDETKKGMEILEKAIEISRKSGFYSIYLPARLLQSYVFEEMGDSSAARIIEEEIIKENAARGLSMTVFPESREQGQFIFNSIDNDQVEFIISNLLIETGVKPGPWLDHFIEKMASSNMDGKRFDRKRFIRFLQSQKESVILSDRKTG